MKNHIIISTNVERAFAYIQNLSFLITRLLSFETFLQRILIMSHTLQLIPDQLSPLIRPLSWSFLFFFKPVASDLCCPTALGCGACPGCGWLTKSHTVKEESLSLSPELRSSTLWFGFVCICKVLCVLLRLLGVPMRALPVVSGKHCVLDLDVIYTPALTMFLLFHNHPWASGKSVSYRCSVQGWEFHSLLFSARWTVAGLHVSHRLL